jgi:hypothetical protein
VGGASKSRLPVWFALNGITNMKQAGLPRFIADKCGCFSFHNYTFQAGSPRPPVKKPVAFLFSEKAGFKACYGKQYYGVKFLEFLNKGKKSHLPEVAKRLIHDSFFTSFTSVKVPELTDRKWRRGERFAR